MPPIATNRHVERAELLGSGEHSDWDEYRSAMQRQGKCLIRVSIDRWGPIAKGGFPARLVGDDV